MALMTFKKLSHTHLNDLEYFETHVEAHSRDLSLLEYYEKSEDLELNCSYEYGDTLEYFKNPDGAYYNRREILYAITNNQCPKTLKPLRLRKAKKPFFSSVISAPKVISVLALFVGDKEVLKAWNQAVKYALTQMQPFAATRVRKNRSDENRFTKNFLVFANTHLTSRALDPQLHTHLNFLNHTFDPEEKTFKALNPVEITRRTKYFQALILSKLKRSLTDLGYHLDDKRPDLGVLEVPKQIEELFSTRSKDIKDLYDKKGLKNKNIPLKLQKKIKATLALETRASKSKAHTLVAKPHGSQELTLSDYKTYWRSKCDSSQLDALTQALRLKSPPHPLALQDKTKPPPLAPTSINVANFTDIHLEAIEKAKQYVFERSVHLPDHELLTKICELTGAQFDLGLVGKLISSDPTLVKAKNLEVGYLPMIKSEIDSIKRLTHGSCTPLVNKALLHKILKKHSQTLLPDQLNALEITLSSNTPLTIIHGAPGTGKSYVIKALIESLKSLKITPKLCASTLSAKENLQADSLDAETLAYSIFKPNYFSQNDFLILDEASLIGIKDFSRLSELIKTYNLRLCLIGDSKQNLSIQAGNTFSYIYKFLPITKASLTSIKRQKNAHYLATVQAYSLAIEAYNLNPSSENQATLFNLFENLRKTTYRYDTLELPNVVELKPRNYETLDYEKLQEHKKGAMYKSATKMYQNLIEKNLTPLVIAPTWKMINDFTDILRSTLIKNKMLSENQTKAISLQTRSFTQQELTHPHTYKVNQNLSLLNRSKIALKNTRSHQKTTFNKNQTFKLIQVKDNSIIVKPTGTLTSEVSRVLASQTFEIPLNQKNMSHFSAYEEKLREFSVGDKIRLTTDFEISRQPKKLKTPSGATKPNLHDPAPGKQNTNSLRSEAALKNLKKGKTFTITDETKTHFKTSLGLNIPKSFKGMTHAYAIPSISAQGLTSDYTLELDSSIKGATTMRNFYVSYTRARHGYTLFTQDYRSYVNATLSSPTRATSIEWYKDKFDKSTQARVMYRMESHFKAHPKARDNSRYEHELYQTHTEPLKTQSVYRKQG